MFKIPIFGEIDGKIIKVILGRRYKISTSDNEFEGTVAKMEIDGFLIKTTEGVFIINFDNINNIEEVFI